MKKIILPFAFLLLITNINAQIFHENFDAPSLDDSVTSYSSNPPANVGWTINSRLQTSPTNCDSAYVTLGDTVILTTDVFSTIGYNTIILSFNHICKVDFFDVARVEASANAGITWLPLATFSAASYMNWLPMNNYAIPDNSWWHQEYYNVTSLLFSSLNASIRFILYDDFVPGGNNNNGWKIDDIIVDSTFTIGFNSPLPLVDQGSGVRFYPNPANEFIIIECEAPENKKYEIIISDVLGKACLQTPFSQPTAKIDIHSLQNGIYFIRVLQNGNHIKNLKVVKY